jgi:steroid delta-isomerase-like uncharacterized protein
MTRPEILAMLTRRAEAWSRLDAAALALDYADDAIVESPMVGGPTRGREAIAQLFQTYFVAFPDLEMQQHDVIIDGDRAVIVATFIGTDSGGFMGLAPTSRRVSIPVVFLYEFAAGLIVRDRRVYDFTSVLLQVGALKAKPG